VFTRLGVQVGPFFGILQLQFSTHFSFHKLVPPISKTKTKLNSVALVRDRTIPTERPPLVGEVVPTFADSCYDNELNVLFRARLSEVRLESLFGPRPGTTVGEGSYNMLIRLIHNREQLTMCKYRYHVTGEATFLLRFLT
jgi:hypothetical protein